MPILARMAAASAALTARRMSSAIAEHLPRCLSKLLDVYL